MTRAAKLAALAELQGRFGAMLQTPLDRASGTLRATPTSYDADLVRVTLPGRSLDAAARLAIYNRQYWFRLFGVLHGVFPLTTRLLGHWSFNDYAARFLLANPPRGWDIDEVGAGFEAFLAQVVPASGPVERQALIEAAHIDAAFHRVIAAPPTQPYRPTAADTHRLASGRLRPSPASSLLVEHWPLFQLRRDLAGDVGESAVDLPPPLEEPRAWALVRAPTGFAQIPLAVREGRLLALLAEHSVGEALAQLEAECPEAERATLPESARKWLARSVELGMWVGLDDQ